MGWWGYDSDANDDTFNCMGVGLPERLKGADAAAVNVKLLDGVATLIDQGATEELVFEPRIAFVGVTRLALVQSLAVPLDHLKRARSYALLLLSDESHVESFTDPEQRRASLRDEIAVFEDALTNGGRSALAIPSESLIEKAQRASD